MNILKIVKHNKHIQINHQDFMTYEYARSIDFQPTTKYDVWIIKGITYYPLENMGVSSSSPNALFPTN
jgi:hypothetical protein